MRSRVVRRIQLAVVLVLSSVFIVAIGDSNALALSRALYSAAWGPGRVSAAAGQTTVTLTARADAGVESAYADQARGELTYLPVYNMGTNEYGRSLVLFGLADLPADAIIDSASLNLYLEDAHTAASVDLTAKMVTGNWDESTVTWNTKPATGNPTYTDLPVDGIYPAYKSLDVTGIVEAWREGSNYGLEVSGPENGTRYERIFESREVGTHPPQLQITYHFPPGDWSNFTPADWVTNQTVTCSAQVESAAGLALAQYWFSTNGGTSWNGPFGAQLSGAGSTWTVTALSVPFGQDTIAGSNRIQFYVQDIYGTPASSTHFVYVDATSPASPTGMSGDAPVSTWINRTGVYMSWSGATDAASGVQGYSYQWSSAASTLPDTTMDTTSLFAATSVPGDRNDWYFHVRTVDNAGNWGQDAAHLGPFMVDTAPPTNPTGLTSSTHVANTWSKVNKITWQWSGAGDGLSGVAGYSYVWDHAATTVPDAGMDTTATSVTSPALADGLDWYFHVRAVDRAGNAAAGAAHLGPFKIDTVAPPSTMVPLNPTQDTTQFAVSWEGYAGVGSPVVSYDVYVRDESSLIVGEYEWLTATTATSATFTGLRGHRYYFSSRARDGAGNQEAYPGTPDTDTIVGRSTEILVRDEWGSPRVAAKVYLNGEYVGVTDSQGELTVDYALKGDPIIALYQVYEHASPRSQHSTGGSGNWNWRVYQTNLAFTSSGTPSPDLIGDTYQTQKITVYRSRPLIGFHLVISVQWDADDTYLQALEYGLRNANDFLYDATDGQMFWDVIEVYDNEAWQKIADMFIVASGGRAQAGVGEIESATGRMVIYRPFVSMDVSGGNPGLDGGSRVMVHEFGHYGLHLDDEYRDRSGAEGTGAYCASNLSSTAATYAASIMNNQSITSELCSEVDPNHKHMTNTAHDAANSGESTWDTVLRRYKSTQFSSSLWTMNSPDTRGSVMVGPTAIPAPDWTTIYYTNVGSGACDPFTVTVTDIGSGTAMAGVSVHVVYSGSAGASTGLTWLPQGTTDTLGKILIVGAHNGDLVVALASGRIGLLTVSGCAGTSVGWSGEEATAQAEAGDPLVLEPAPYSLSLSLLPLDSATLDVRVASSVSLPSVPLVALWQEAAEQAVAVDLTYDAQSGQYRGQVGLDASLAPAGYVAAYAEDASGGEVWAYQPFDLSPVAAGQFTTLYSPDGQFGLVLLPDSLAGDAQVSILQDVAAGSAPAGAVQVGPAYQALLIGGQSALAANATVNLHYGAEAATEVDLDTVRLYRWDGTRWTEVPGARHSATDQVATASVDELGTYALFGRPAAASGEQRICLPLVMH